MVDHLCLCLISLFGVGFLVIDWFVCLVIWKFVIVIVSLE